MGESNFYLIVHQETDSSFDELLAAAMSAVRMRHQ